jgi:hypothetical protein
VWRRDDSRCQRQDGVRRDDRSQRQGELPDVPAALLKPGRRQLDLLAMSKLLSIFEYFDDEAEALERCSALAV